MRWQRFWSCINPFGVTHFISGFVIVKLSIRSGWFCTAWFTMHCRKNFKNNGSGCRNTSSNEVKDLQNHSILTFVVIWLASLLLFSVLNHRKLNILSFRLLVRHKKKFKDTSGSRKLLCAHYCIKWLTKNLFIDEWILLVIPLSPCDTISHQIR